MKQLNILDLHRSINEKKNRTTECYEKVLDICHKRIQKSANSQQMRCLIEVPCLVFGYPIFDYNKCLEYVYKSLIKNGFIVKYYFPKHLYISWDFEEIEATKKKNDMAARASAAAFKNCPLLTKPPSKATLSYKPSGKLRLDFD